MARTTIRSEDIANTEVTNAKVADDAIGVDELSATGTASSSTFLRGDNAWSTIETGTSWQAVTTGATLTAVAGNGYPINTTSNACTVTLPASASVGDTIEFVDYARKWATYAVTINQNSLKYQGYTSPNPVYNTAGESLRIVYVDATQGWVPVFDGAVVNEVPQTSDIEWLVIGGAGGGGCGRASPYQRAGGGAGAGGYRNSFSSEASGGGASTETPITGMAQGIVLTATIGAGGAGGSGSGNSGTVGADSSLIGTGISVTSNGGGKGGAWGTAGGTGGSGGGGGADVGNGAAGTSNQGYAGGDGASSSNAGGGGGGAASVGSNNSSDTGGAGGAGLNNTITGASVGRGGGGGGGGSTSGGAATHGGGNGGNGTSGAVGLAGTANTGGGGGGQGDGPTFTGGTGGSGVVILRLLTASYSGTTTGSPTITTDGSYTVITFTGTGTYTT